MPLKLVPPRAGKTPYWSIRGTYLGRYVDRSTKARKRAHAAKVLEKWQREIERGNFHAPGEPTFADAALAYMQAGGERLYLRPLLQRFGSLPLSAISQAAIDTAAVDLYPNAAPATRNRSVYTPASAVLKHAGIDAKLRRPKGADGQRISAFLWPEEAAKLIEAAKVIDPEFAALLIVLLYTGLRLSEAITMLVDNVRLAESFAYLPTSKNGEPRAVFLPKIVKRALRTHPRGMKRSGARVFRFAKNGHIYHLLRAAAAQAGVTLPERAAFHIFRHTYATWMRRYAGLDTRGLRATGNWKDQKSAERYAHVVPMEEARRAELLPVEKLRNRRP